MKKRKALNILILSFPFLDLITSLLTRNFDVTFRPGVIIKSLFMIVMLFYMLKTCSKYKKLCFGCLSLYAFYFLFYFIFKPELLNSTFLIGEFSYLFKMFYFPVIFLGLLCFYDDNSFNKKEVLSILKYNLISFTILLLIPLLFETAYATYIDTLKGYIGWFYAGNEIANIMIILSPLVMMFIDKKNKYQFLIFLPIIYAILNIGTKVSLLGLLIVSILSFVFILIKEKKIKSIYVIESFIVLLASIFMGYNSYAVENYKYVLKNNYIEPEEIVVDKKNASEVAQILSNMNAFYEKKGSNRLFKTLLSGRDIYLANTLSIYDNTLSDSNIWFGIGFSNTKTVDNSNITKLVEIDLIDAYFHYGIVGLLVIISPFIISLVLMIKSKKRITLDSCYYILIVLLMLGISCLSGHTLMAPAVSIYLIFYLLLLLNEFDIFKRKIILKDKISILSLHMNIGGIERSICNQANMLSENFNVEIVSLYKIVNQLPYKININVKMIYLSDMKPNKEEFLYCFKKHDIKGIIEEGFKSIKILYNKKKYMKEFIYNSDSKIIISTRLEFTKLLNDYGNSNSVRIAEEHVYHHNNGVYINKLRTSLENINYLIPASKYLTDDYNNFFKNEKVKVIYIPQVIDEIPKGINKLNTKNLIAVGRLVKEKGFEDLVEIMKLICKKNSNLKLTIVGDGPEKEYLISLVKKYRLNKNICFAGNLNSNELKKIYKKASLLVMTSFEESFGLVLLEAMSYGIPCFAFDSALGAKEIINDTNGILVSNRDNSKMAGCILDYFDHYFNCFNEVEKTISQYSFVDNELMWCNFLLSVSNIKKNHN